jgi:hypothetical protein
LRSRSCLGRDFLELLVVVVSEAVLVLVVTLVAIVVHVGGVNLLPLGAIGDELSGVTKLKAAPG